MVLCRPGERLSSVDVTERKHVDIVLGTFQQMALSTNQIKRQYRGMGVGWGGVLRLMLRFECLFVCLVFLFGFLSH